MRKFARAECPQALKDKGAEWTATLVERGRWTSWPQYKTRGLNQELLANGLRSQTQDHCSYCDITPVCPPSRETIDHFRPKSGAKGRLDLAFEWTNLFYCCDNCQQQKREDFEEALLKPDEPDYEFLKYFQWEFATGRLLPSEVATQVDQHRAERTIELLKLNDKHPYWRVIKRNELAGHRPDSLDDCSYRDFLELALA